MIDSDPLYKVLDWVYYSNLAELSYEAKRCAEANAMIFRLTGEREINVPMIMTDDVEKRAEWAFVRLSILRNVGRLQIARPVAIEVDEDEEDEAWQEDEL